MPSDGFDPQALTSLTQKAPHNRLSDDGFDPQALTSLTDASSFANGVVEWFRSTGSYEPDQKYRERFFTSGEVSIHRLLRA